MSTETINFQEIKTYAEKSGKCVKCGKQRQRRKKFWQTVNPFNKTASGRVKNSFDIMPELQAEARTWKKEPIDCCE